MMCCSAITSTTLCAGWSKYQQEGISNGPDAVRRSLQGSLDVGQAVGKPQGRRVGQHGHQPARWWLPAGRRISAGAHAGIGAAHLAPGSVCSAGAGAGEPRCAGRAIDKARKRRHLQLHSWRDSGRVDASVRRTRQTRARMADLTSSGLWNIVAFQSPPKIRLPGQPTSLGDAIALATLSDTFFEIRTISRQRPGAKASALMTDAQPRPEPARPRARASGTSTHPSA